MPSARRLGRVCQQPDLRRPRGAWPLRRAYGQYLLDDVLVGRVPAKLQVFLSAWALAPQAARPWPASGPPASSAPGATPPDTCTRIGRTSRGSGR